MPVLSGAHALPAAGRPCGGRCATSRGRPSGACGGSRLAAGPGTCPRGRLAAASRTDGTGTTAERIADDGVAAVLAQLRIPPGERRPESPASSRHERRPHGAAGSARRGALQLGERRARRECVRPSVRAPSSSDGETVAPLEPPRLQNGPARSRRHALAEPVGTWPASGYWVGRCASRQFSLSPRSCGDPEPARHRFACLGLPVVRAAGGESSHVRRDSQWPLVAPAWHGVPSSNYPHRGSFRPAQDAEDGGRAFGRPQ